MFRSILLLFSILWWVMGPVQAYSQVNIEKIRGTSAEKGFSTTLSLALSTRSGNVDLTTLSGEVRTDFAQKRARSFLLARGDLGWKDSDRFSDEGLIHARYTYLFSHNINFESFSQYNYDTSRLLDTRFLGGGGVRTALVDNKQITVAFGSAAMVEYERYDLPAGARHPRKKTVTRWSNYINLKSTWNETGSLTWIVYAQPRFDRFEDLRILSEATLAAGLSAKLSISITARIRYDRDPPDGIEDLDTIVLSGVGMEF